MMTILTNYSRSYFEYMCVLTFNQKLRIINMISIKSFEEIYKPFNLYYYITGIHFLGRFCVFIHFNAYLLIFFIYLESGTQQRERCTPICWLIPQMPTRARRGQTEARSPEFHSGLPFSCTGDQAPAPSPAASRDALARS